MHEIGSFGFTFFSFDEKTISGGSTIAYLKVMRSVFKLLRLVFVGHVNGLASIACSSIGVDDCFLLVSTPACLRF